MRVLLLFVMFISVGCGAVQAAEKSMAVTVPVFTRHFPDADPDLNERNHGLGLEYMLQKDVALTAGFFNNSFKKDTVYVGVVYTPFRVAGLHTGLVLGLDVSGGYDSVNPFHPVIGALRFSTGGESPVGFNVDILPGGSNTNGYRVYGATAVSMKYLF